MVPEKDHGTRKMAKYHFEILKYLKGYETNDLLKKFLVTIINCRCYLGKLKLFY